MNDQLISGFSSALDLLLNPLAQSWAESGYFALIYDFIHNEILDFRDNVLGRATSIVGGIALVLMTIWIFFQALRIVTGQSRDSMMALVMNSLKATLIIAAATALGVAGSDAHDLLTEDLQTSITRLVTGEENSSPKQQIDENLLYMHLATTSIDAVQIVHNDQILNDKKQQALMLASVGTAGPAMTGAAMLLLYEVAIAMFIGFGPIFIMCLLFDATKSLFQRWLLYGIGTMFSMAVLSAMVAISTKVVVAVAAAFWTTAAAGSLLGLNFSDGFTGIALQQGGIGLLLTVLLISTPPMAASFFQGTLGSFMYHSAVSSGQNQGVGTYQDRNVYRDSRSGGASSGNTAQPHPNSSEGYLQRAGGGDMVRPNTGYNNPVTNPNYGGGIGGGQPQTQQGRMGAATKNDAPNSGGT
jgi:type IV secretion system protein VirB6